MECEICIIKKILKAVYIVLKVAQCLQNLGPWLEGLLFL